MKALYSGAGLAIAAGLLMGAAMKPDLGADNRPAGPQIFPDWSAHSTGPFDDGAAAFAAYSSKIPDYVIGTDWQKAVAQPAAYVEPQPREEHVDADAILAQAEAEARAQAIAWQEPPHEASSYPSMDGNGRFEEQRRQERDADQQRSAQDMAVQMDASAQIDDDAPVEATGDTSTN